MAEIEQTEFAIIPPGETSGVDWVDDRAQAIAAAEARGAGWKVQKIVTYCSEREVIHTVGLNSDDSEDEA